MSPFRATAGYRPSTQLARGEERQSKRESREERLGETKHGGKREYKKEKAGRGE